MEFSASVNTQSSTAKQDFAYNNSHARSFLAQDPIRTEEIPRYPCLEENCDKTFSRCHEFARHAEDVHQPELKLSCPHQGCNQRCSRSRFHRLKTHYNQQHDASAVLCHELCVPKPFIQKVWGCGFCVMWVGSWKDLAKHTWTHFQAGVSKRDWSGSLYIQSLLHHPSVRNAWLALVATRTDGDHIAWSDRDVQHLREELEWLNPSRKQGSVLAKEAFGRLAPSTSLNQDTSESAYFPFGQTSVLPDFSSLEVFVEAVDPWTVLATYPQEFMYEIDDVAYGINHTCDPKDNGFDFSSSE